jgi:hypothetical protein
LRKHLKDALFWVGITAGVCLALWMYLQMFYWSTAIEPGVG